MIPLFFPGDRLGPYVLEDFFHVGNMAVIYNVKEEKVLIKAPYADLSSRFYRQFRDEITALSLLNHPGILKPREKETGKNPWFAMEKLEGESLCQRLKKENRLDSRTAAQITLDIAQTIAHAHRNSPPVWHCDLKPSHVFFHRTHTFILDFGLVRFDRFFDESIQGSLPYMAPEQLRGLADARSDVYAIGAILYHMLHGTPPFPKKDEEESETAIIERILDLELAVPMPDDRNPALIAICKKALVKRADSRYADAAEIAKAIAQIDFASMPHSCQSKA